MTDPTAPLWKPEEEQIAATQIAAFMRRVNEQHGAGVQNYADLHRWSVAQSETFWCAVWDFCGVIAETRGERAVADKTGMPGARWFPDARLNFAENLLRRRDDGDAIVFRGEDRVRRRLSHGDLYAQVSRLAQWLKAAGIGPGDRIAGFLPNLPETCIAMLATASLGAIWSSCSPDFGVRGVLDRFGQIEPKIFICADGYFYGGKRFDSLAKAREILAELPSVERVLVVPYSEDEPALDGLDAAVCWPEALDTHAPGEIDFHRQDFNAPLYILYSSGTTGAPKCIVHGAGGTLLQHLKEQRLQADIRPDDRFFYFTTCGWMMWNWLMSGLASGATLLLYDGSPFHPDGNAVFDFAAEERMTHLGTSAKAIDALMKAGLRPRDSHDLSALRAMLSTGSPLSPQGFDYVYEAIKPDLHLASISGGTDIVSCFMGGNPISPVYRGEIQGPGLGMDVQVFDDSGRPVEGNQGELVCCNSFPSMPIGFWKDEDGSRYRAAYFEDFPGVWRHGDWTEITPQGGFVIYGRSDATLNPGGVRIGTAEIYRQVEQLDEVLEALVIGQRWDNDVRVVLFVTLREGFTLDDDLTARIRARIRSGASPRHVPAKVIQAPDIPRTINGKITELAVSHIVHGRAVKNREALANPEVLAFFQDLPELQV